MDTLKKYGLDWNKMQSYYNKIDVLQFDNYLVLCIYCLTSAIFHFSIKEEESLYLLFGECGGVDRDVGRLRKHNQQPRNVFESLMCLHKDDFTSYFIYNIPKFALI